MRLSFGLALLLTGAACLGLSAACGSSSTGTGGAGPTAGPTTSPASSGAGGMTASSASSGAGGMGTGGAGGMANCTKGPMCDACCASNNQAAFAAFGGYELKECACTMPAEGCAMECMAECADPTKLMMGTPCSDCLQMIAMKGMMSACTTKAGLTDCANDPKCTPFLTCEVTNCL
jgi:hypothetical protein